MNPRLTHRARDTAKRNLAEKRQFRERGFRGKHQRAGQKWEKNERESAQDYRYAHRYRARHDVDNRYGSVSRKERGYIREYAQSDAELSSAVVAEPKPLKEKQKEANILGRKEILSLATTMELGQRFSLKGHWVVYQSVFQKLLVGDRGPMVRRLIDILLARGNIELNPGPQAQGKTREERRAERVDPSVVAKVSDHYDEVIPQRAITRAKRNAERYAHFQTDDSDEYEAYRLPESDQDGPKATASTSASAPQAVDEPAAEMRALPILPSQVSRGDGPTDPAPDVDMEEPTLYRVWGAQGLREQVAELFSSLETYPQSGTDESEEDDGQEVEFKPPPPAPPPPAVPSEFQRALLDAIKLMEDPPPAPQPAPPPPPPAYMAERLAPKGVRLLDGVRPTIKQIEPVLTRYAKEPCVVDSITYKTLSSDSDQRLLSFTNVDSNRQDYVQGTVHYNRYPDRRPFKSVFIPNSVLDRPHWYQRVYDWVVGPEPVQEQLLFAPHQVAEALDTVPLHVNEETLKANVRQRVANVIKMNIPDVLRTGTNAGSELVCIAVGPEQLNSMPSNHHAGPCVARPLPNAPASTSLLRYTQLGSNQTWPACRVQSEPAALAVRRRTAGGFRRRALHEISGLSTSALCQVTRLRARIGTIPTLLIGASLSALTLYFLYRAVRPSYHLRTLSVAMLDGNSPPSVPLNLRNISLEPTIQRVESSSSELLLNRIWGQCQRSDTSKASSRSLSLSALTSLRRLVA